MFQNLLLLTCPTKSQLLLLLLTLQVGVVMLVLAVKSLLLSRMFLPSKLVSTLLLVLSLPPSQWVLQSSSSWVLRTSSFLHD